MAGEVEEGFGGEGAAEGFVEEVDLEAEAEV